MIRPQKSLRGGGFANADGEELRGEASHLFIGARARPMADDPDVEVSNIKAKVEAGADFVSTQLCYMPERLEPFLGATARR